MHSVCLYIYIYILLYTLLHIQIYPRNSHLAHVSSFGLGHGSDLAPRSHCGSGQYPKAVPQSMFFSGSASSSAPALATWACTAAQTLVNCRTNNNQRLEKVRMGVYIVYILYCIALHCVTLPCIAVHYIPLHYVVFCHIWICVVIFY